MKWASFVGKEVKENAHVKVINIKTQDTWKQHQKCNKKQNQDTVMTIKRQYLENICKHMQNVYFILMSGQLMNIN